MSSPKTVMLVDDTDLVRRLLRRGLEGTGRFRVVAEAGDGQAALAAAGCGADVILLDLSMPVMDGLTALPLLRSACPAAAIVVLTGVVHDALQATVSGGGADLLLNKGCRLVDLVAALERLPQVGSDCASTGGADAAGDISQAG